MTLINNLETKHNAQAVVEYIVMFTVLMICIILVFGGLSTNKKLGTNPTIKSAFDSAVASAISEIEK